MVLSELATGGALSSLFSDRLFRATRLNQASISFAILLLPASAALALFGHPLLAVLLAAATAATICALAGTAAKTVLFAGLPMGLLLYRWRGRFAHVAAVYHGRRNRHRAADACAAGALARAWRNSG